MPTVDRGPVPDGFDLQAPRLIVLAGLPGAGKSTLAGLLLPRIPAVWLRVDTLEAAMLAAGLPRSFETGLAAYLGVRDQARDHLRLHRTAIIDAVNGVEEARTMWRELSTELPVPRFTIELVCSDPAEHRRRVESRALPTPPLPKPSWEEVVHREYHPWKEPVLRVDTVRPLEESLSRVLHYLEGTLPPDGPER